MPVDIVENKLLNVPGLPFYCDVCQSCVYNNRSRGVRKAKVSEKLIQPSIRYSEEGERLSLCLLCSKSSCSAKRVSGGEYTYESELVEKLHETRLIIYQ